MDSNTEKKKTKYKVTIHESAISGEELRNFLKGINNIEISVVSSLPFTQDAPMKIYQKYGSQIDDVKAKVRLANVVPGLQDYVLFGMLEYNMAMAYSVKYPDSNVYILPGEGETRDDIYIPEGSSLKPTNWQIFHEYIANKTDSKSKFTSKAEKSIKPKGKSNGAKSKPKSEDIARVNKANRPTEVDDEPESNEPNEEYNEEQDPRYN